MPDVTVRFKVLDGTWEVCGPDRGVWPENFQATADMWGAKTCSFDLKRNPARPWPDLLPFTPVEVEVDGIVVWEGRTIEAPSRDGMEQVMSVQCEGWQHHLDDDLVDIGWVNTRLADWKDIRTHPDANLAAYITAWGIDTSGKPKIAWPKGQAASGSGGIYFDAGPGRTIKKVVWVASSNTWGAANALYVNGFDSIAAGPAEFYSPGAIVAGTDYNDGWTLTTPRRYVEFRVDSNSHTPSVDEWLSFSRIAVFVDDAYESGGASTLKASTVVGETLDRGTVLLSADRSGIETTGLSLPEFWPDGFKTPREIVNAVNGLQGGQFKIGAGKRPIYREFPTRPVLTIGDWSAAEVQDAASNSGADLFNKVIVTGTDPAGRPVSVERHSSVADPEGFMADPGVYWPNPSFVTNTTGWTTVAGSLSRTTTGGEYDSAPAGGKLTDSTLGVISTSATGSLQPGRVYKVTCRVKGSASQDCAIQIGSDGGVSGSNETSVTTSWQTITLYYLARPGDTSLGFLAGFGVTGSFTLYVDSLTLEVASRTVMDRRGVRRAREVQVNSTLPSDGVLAAAIGDTWLANHASSPFRGSVNATGPDAVRDRQSEQPVPLARLLRDTGQLIHFSNRVDPVTGANGINGRIAEIRWTADTDTAEVTLDNTRTNFETLLSRIAMAQG